MRLIVTGGLGFIGSNLIRWILTHHPDVDVLNIDGLTYAGNPANLADMADNPRYQFKQLMIDDKPGIDPVFEAFQPDAVLHLAAESHVDRSIHSGLPFVTTNVVGTQVLLEAARRHRVQRFIHVSTDEVYGSVEPPDAFRESDPLNPSSPYSASKAGSDLLVLAAFSTYAQDVVVTRSSNNYGPYQFPEKLIPRFITSGLRGKPWPLYGDGVNIRDWIFVDDHVRALWAVLQRGVAGEIYNIAADNPRTNWDVARQLTELMNLPLSIIERAADRPGHDRRYALDTRKIRDTVGWQPEVSWDAALAQTVDWYQNHPEWWQRLLAHDG